MASGALPYGVDETLGVIVVRMVQQPSLDDWIATLDAIAGDSRLSGYNVITDRRTLPVPTAQYVRGAIRAIADRFSAHPSMRWATVAPPGALAYGMGRMAELVGESTGVNFRMFESLDEAQAWATVRR